MSLELSIEEVERIAALARLDLTEAERQLFRRQLGEILGYAMQIQSVDTAGVEATAHAAHRATPLRDDEPAASLERDEALANAPDADRDAGLFRVPKVIG